MSDGRFLLKLQFEDTRGYSSVFSLIGCTTLSTRPIPWPAKTNFTFWWKEETAILSPSFEDSSNRKIWLLQNSDFIGKKCSRYEKHLWLQWKTNNNKITFVKIKTLKIYRMITIAQLAKYSGFRLILATYVIDRLKSPKFFQSDKSQMLPNLLSGFNCSLFSDV